MFAADKDIILSAVSTIMMIRDDFVDDRGVVLIQMVVGGQQGEQGRVVGECVLERVQEGNENPQRGESGSGEKKVKAT